MLDLVITDEYYIQNLIFKSPLRKSVKFDYNLIPGINNNTNRNRHNYTKGDYESLRGSLQLPCNDILSPHSDDNY